MVFTKQLEAVQSVKDPTSDMSVFSRKGSQLVKEKREQIERQKVWNKFLFVCCFFNIIKANCLHIKAAKNVVEVAGTGIY